MITATHIHSYRETYKTDVHVTRQLGIVPYLRSLTVSRSPHRLSSSSPGTTIHVHSQTGFNAQNKNEETGIILLDTQTLTIIIILKSLNRASRQPKTLCCHLVETFFTPELLPLFSSIVMVKTFTELKNLAQVHNVCGELMKAQNGTVTT